MGPMIEKVKVMELAENVSKLLGIYQQQNVTTRKLLRICLKHLKDRRRLIPAEVWEERQKLIAALEEFTRDKQEDNHEP